MIRLLVFIVLFVVTSSTGGRAENSLPSIYALLLGNDIGTVKIVKQFEETSYNLKDVAFVSDNLGWAVGSPHWDTTQRRYRGTIVKTDDGGISWEAQYAGTNEAFRSVCFVDSDTGWAVGENGTIVHTENGGILWKKQSVNTDDDFIDVACTDTKKAWATSISVTHYDSWGNADNWKANLWYAGDGGQNWSLQNVPREASILRGLTFVNSTLGWVVGMKYIGDDQYGSPDHRPVVYTTTNGGQMWLEQSFPDLEISLTSAHFIDADHGWVVGFPTRSSITGGFVFCTVNGGSTWTRQEPGGFFSPLWDVRFLDANRGYVVGFDYISAWGPPVWRTEDGGATWSKIRLEKHENNGLFGLSVRGDRVVAVGDHDYITISDNPWGTYSSYGEDLFYQRFINIHYNFSDIFFADEEHGWAVGSRSYLPGYTGQVIFFTNDGGMNWQMQYEDAPDLTVLPADHHLNSVYFTDSQTGWAFGTSKTVYGTGGWEHHGAILHTTDGGKNWIEQGEELYDSWDLEFVSTQFLDNLKGWALAVKRFPNPNIHLIHTVNGGLSWQWMDTGLQGSATWGGAVHFVDNHHGWSVSGLGNLIATEDGGFTWQRKTISEYIRLSAVHFLTPDEGWVVGEGGYMTTNGGDQWSEMPLDAPGDLMDIARFTDGRGWLAGENGALYYTKGRGRWHRIDSPSSASFRSLSFPSASKGWLAGDHGTILQIIHEDVN